MSQSKLTPLEARKRLLIAESQLNRKMLLEDYEALQCGWDHLTAPVRQAHSWVSRMISLFSFVRSLGTRPAQSHNGTHSGRGLPSRLLRLGAALWVGMKTSRN